MSVKQACVDPNKKVPATQFLLPGNLPRVRARSPSFCASALRDLTGDSSLHLEQLFFRPLRRLAGETGADAAHGLDIDGRAMVAPFAADVGEDAGDFLIVEG